MANDCDNLHLKRGINLHSWTNKPLQNKNKVLDEFVVKYQ